MSDTLDKFSPKCFFKLDEFEHSDVFVPGTPVWRALGKGITDYLDAFFLKTAAGIFGEVEQGAFIQDGPIYLAKGAKIEAGAYVRGPCIIGEGTEIRHGAYIRGNTIIGKNCVVGHSTEVKGSIFLNDAKAGHFAYVGDSILGNSVNLGAGTKLANLKIYAGSVVLRSGSDKFDSGLKKFGAILGDGFQSGCNSVTNPGFIAAKESLVYPCISARGVHLDTVRIISDRLDP